MVKLLIIINAVLSAGVFAVLMFLLDEGFWFSAGVTIIAFVGVMLFEFVIMGFADWCMATFRGRNRLEKSEPVE